MLRNRLITALVLGLAFVGALLFLPDTAWALFLLVFIAIGAWEWGELVGYGRGGRIGYFAATVVAGLLLLPDLPGMEAASAKAAAALLLASAVFWLLLAPLWLLNCWKIHGRITAALVGWVVLLPPWIALVLLRHINPGVVLAVMLTVVLADSAAYFCGKRFGQRKLAPAISPGKTWEGLVGALVAVAAAAAGICLWRGLSGWFVAGFLAVTVLSVIGDLFESLLKRQAGMKDSGNILPGHGGVLDRIDGLTSTLPLVAFYVYLYLPWLAQATRA